MKPYYDDGKGIQIYCGDWGSYIQGKGDFEHLNQIGTALNQHLNEAIHYPAFDKRLFECTCNIVFPVWMIEGAILTNNWSLVDKRHKEGNI